MGVMTKWERKASTDGGTRRGNLMVVSKSTVGEPVRKQWKIAAEGPPGEHALAGI